MGKHKYSKVICVTVAYCNWHTFEYREDMLHSRFNAGSLDERWCIYAHYPEQDNYKNILRVCNKYKISFFDVGKNLGHVGNLNYFIKKRALPDATFMIKIDPDLMPPNKFDVPMIEVARADKSMAVVSLWNSALPPFCTGHQLEIIARHPVAFWDSCKLGAIYGVDIGFIKKAGGFKQAYKNWGGTEGNLFKDVKRLGRRWGYIYDVVEEYPKGLAKLLDSKYQMWKFYILTHKYKHGYEDYLKAGAPNLDNAPEIDNRIK